MLPLSKWICINLIALDQYRSINLSTSRLKLWNINLHAVLSWVAKWSRKFSRKCVLNMFVNAIAQLARERCHLVLEAKNITLGDQIVKNRCQLRAILFLIKVNASLGQAKSHVDTSWSFACDFLHSVWLENYLCLLVYFFKSCRLRSRNAKWLKSAGFNGGSEWRGEEFCMLEIKNSATRYM